MLSWIKHTAHRSTNIFFRLYHMHGTSVLYEFRKQPWWQATIASKLGEGKYCFRLSRSRLGQFLGRLVSVSSWTKNRTSRSRLGCNVKRLGLVSVSDMKVSFTSLVNWVISNVYGQYAVIQLAEGWRLMPYDVWTSHTLNQTRGIWSETKSIIHYNIKPRVSECEWITYSGLLRVDQLAPPVFEPVNNRFRSRRANHSATAPHYVHIGRGPAYLTNSVQTTFTSSTRSGLRSASSTNYVTPRLRMH